MNWFNQLKKTKLVAIKNFDEELYRLVKVYASLEGRTIASIFEEAVRLWLENRRDYEEVRLWVSLEEAYKKNFEVLKRNIGLLSKREGGYAIICDGRLLGFYDNYEDAVRKCRETCRIHSLIIELPYREKTRKIDLGLPW